MAILFQFHGETALLPRQRHKTTTATARSKKSVRSIYSSFRFHFERVSGLVDISVYESLSRTQRRNGLTQIYVIKLIRSRNRTFSVFTTLRSQALEVKVARIK